MNKKMMTSLAVCLLMGLTIVSAVSVDNVESSYNRKENTVSFSFDKILNNECGYTYIEILDKKGNIVGGSTNNALAICSIGYPGGFIYWDGRKTGTFEYDNTYNLDKLKGKGKLTYQIKNYYSEEVLAEGIIQAIK